MRSPSVYWGRETKDRIYSGKKRRRSRVSPLFVLEEKERLTDVMLKEKVSLGGGGEKCGMIKLKKKESPCRKDIEGD